MVQIMELIKTRQFAATLFFAIVFYLAAQNSPGLFLPTFIAMLLSLVFVYFPLGTLIRSLKKRLKNSPQPN